MRTPAVLRRLPRRWVLRSAAAALGLALAAPHAWAWYRLGAARAELAKYHPEQARTRLATCLEVWPGRASVHLLASRAARQAGDLADADRQLREAQRLSGGSTEAIAFEWALLQASAGNVREVEDYLQRHAAREAADAPLVWEAVTQGYLRLYRSLDAMTTVDAWLARDPENVRALELRGQTYITGRGVKRGSEDLRRAVEMDPERPGPRWLLALATLELGGYDESLRHLEWFLARKPDDPEVLVRYARCLNMLNRGAEARGIVDRVLEAHPDHGMALRTRGQFALADQKPADAERWLRRAVAAWPTDYQTNWLLAQAFQQQGKEAEARAQLKQAEEIKDRTERVGELRSRRLAQQPLDPALHYEMGVLMGRNNRPAEAEQWFQSALGLDPDYGPAHAALADLYEARGDRERAADHRRRAAAAK